MERRIFLLGSLAAGAAAPAFAAANGAAGNGSAAAKADLYGLIGKMKAAPGQRDALIPIMIEGAKAMPGCLSYIVAKDGEDADGIWITEVWESEAAHDASLQLPSVKAAIEKAQGMVAGMDTGVATVPVGGIGLGG